MNLKSSELEAENKMACQVAKNKKPKILIISNLGF